MEKKAAARLECFSMNEGRVQEVVVEASAEFSEKVRAVLEDLVTDEKRRARIGEAIEFLTTKAMDLLFFDVQVKLRDMADLPTAPTSEMLH